MPSEIAYRKGSEFPALEAGKLRVYSMRHCPYAQRARIVMLHKNIEFETVNINLKEKPEWFLELAPLGTVPAIQKDDIIVYDSPIVCQYLDETYPGEKLTPNDPYQKAKDAMLVERYSKKVVTPFYRMALKQEPEALGELLSGLNVLEDELKSRGKTFFGGEKPMMVDFMIWPHMERIVGMGKVNDKAAIRKDQFPNLVAWIDNITAVPAVKVTRCSEEDFIKIMVANKEGKEIYDIGVEQ
ncbi:glutathione S-transferase omega-1-like [Ruditapes philippinarum]|uniref:glutathione S-transferase omega-1-like n=1 Tax=Ruditapes philippinarum TaxID=129788 RepID=UPI00295B5A65|nr:glutathione S-transferase omega-1-like [Ruditapes philippinarum]